MSAASLLLSETFDFDDTQLLLVLSIEYSNSPKASRGNSSQPNLRGRQSTHPSAGSSPILGL